MDHFYQNIKGWFWFRTVYEQAVAEARDGAHFVEVGSWKGRSAAFMAVEIVNSGKKIRFDCVDTWRGSEDMQNLPEVINDTLYDEFLGNIAPVRKYVKPIRMASIEAAKRYRDSSLDFVFIDAGHEYENVKSDIIAWWPKVSSGGVLAGDDYGWAGVTEAVKETFSNYEVISTGDKRDQWHVRKNGK